MKSDFVKSLILIGLWLMKPNLTKDDSKELTTLDYWKELTTFIINRLLVVCGLIYLAFIPLKQVGEDNRLESIDMGFIMVLLIANSDMVQRVSQFKIGKNGVELSIIQEQVEKAIEQKDNLNAEVLKSLDIYLSETIAQKLDDRELQKQINSVSPVIVEYIYFKAKEARHQAWRNNKKGIPERTIPIFKALINSPYGKNRHRFYAQLGYALKEQTAPQLQEWEEARENLEQAIDLWRQENNSDSLPPYYCFNWLICMSEIAKQEKKKYDKKMKNTVRERLRAIRNCSPLLNAWDNPNNKDYDKIKDCKNWLNSNFPNLQKEEIENGSSSDEACHREGYSDT